WDPYKHLATSHPTHKEPQDRASDWFGFTSIQDWSRSQHSLMLEQRQIQLKTGRIIRRRTKSTAMKIIIRTGRQNRTEIPRRLCGGAPGKSPWPALTELRERAHDGASTSGETLAEVGSMAVGMTRWSWSRDTSRWLIFSR